MTSFPISCVTASLLLMFAGSLAAQDLLRAPSLGLIHDPIRKTLHPVLGVPGAAVLGDALPLGIGVEMAAIEPAGSFALLRESGAPDLRIMRSTPDGYFVEPVAGAIEGADRIVLSAVASAAAAYHSGSKRLQLLRGLPWEPAIAREIDISVFDGEVTAIAVSDDGRTALVAFSTDEASSVWSFPPEGDPKSVLPGGKVVSISFVPETSDALITDERHQTIHLLNSDNASTVVAAAEDGIEGPIAAQSSKDRKFVFIAAAGNGRILVVNLEDGSRRELTCSCSLQGLTRMSDEKLFRLGEAAGGPIWLLDAASAEPRLVFVPPFRSELE